MLIAIMLQIEIMGIEMITGEIKSTQIFFKKEGNNSGENLKILDPGWCYMGIKLFSLLLQYVERFNY